MNRTMTRWPLMDEAGEAGGGAAPKGDEAQNADTPKGDEAQNADTPKGEEKPVNLMDDEPEGGGEAPKEDDKTEIVETKEPTEEERTAFVDAVKRIDLGEGVKWDDPALAAIAKPLMALTGGDSAKAEGIVRAYTAYQQEVARKFQEQNDQFLNGLVEQCRTRFGDDLKKVCALAKAGGLRVFGEKVWNVMRQERAFANNPDIIERLAAFGRTATDDPGVVKKETQTGTSKRDWRENMYGKHD